MSAEQIFGDKSDDDGLYAIAYALLQVADAINRLGNGNASTPMGAIEAYGLHIGEKLDRLIDVIGER